MLEFDGASKRFGALAALDGCTFAARPGRLTGFLGPNGAGKTTAMRAVFGLVELDAGAVRWRGAADRTSGARRGSATCPRSGACTRGCGCVISSSTSAGCADARATRWSQASTRWLERLGLADRGERPARRALPRQPATRPAHRRAGQRARPARARRTVLRARSARDRQHVRAARRGGGRRRDRAVLQPPARPRRGPLRGRRHHRPRPHRPRRRPRPSCGPRSRNGSSTSATADAHPTGREFVVGRARRVERRRRSACSVGTATSISPH